MSAPTWIPLESNPEVMTKYINKLGVDVKWDITDVLGLDETSLHFVSRPVKALILLFPFSPKLEQMEKERAAKAVQELPKDLFFMKQTVNNACGVIALMHGLANSSGMEFTGVLKKYLDAAKDLTPEERGKMLESDKEIAEIHKQLAGEGQTSADSEVSHHFVALVHKNGFLYELDGRKDFPIQHGKTDDERFLMDAAELCEKVFEKFPGQSLFSVMALAPVNSE